MSEKKPDITNDILMADLMLRVTTMEKLLIDKEIISREDFVALMEEIAKNVSKIILDKAKSAEDMFAKADLSAEEQKSIKN